MMDGAKAIAILAGLLTLAAGEAGPGQTSFPDGCRGATAWHIPESTRRGFAELADVLPGYVARVSLDAADAAVRDSVGSGRNAALNARTSLSMLYVGALDYDGARDVVASGYVTRPPQLVETEEGWRQLRADAILSEPGIAAAADWRQAPCGCTDL